MVVVTLLEQIKNSGSDHMTRCAHARVLCCFSHARLFATLWTVAHQASLSQALLTFDGSVRLCCHTWAAICCHFTSYTPQSPSALLSSAQTCPSPVVTPKAPSLNNWKKLVYDPYICTPPDYPCSLSSSQEIILRLTTFLITLLWMHPGLATFFLKDGPRNWVSHPLFNKHLLKASYVPGPCSGSRDRNISTRPGTQSSWVDSQAYHSEIVQEVLWGRKYPGPGNREQVLLTQSGRKFQKGFLEETT